MMKEREKGGGEAARGAHMHRNGDGSNRIQPVSITDPN